MLLMIQFYSYPEHIIFQLFMINILDFFCRYTMCYPVSVTGSTKYVYNNSGGIYLLNTSVR